MAFKSSAGTTPYQPAPSIQPKYGFRYSGSPFAPATNPANIPPVNYDIPSYEAPEEPTPYISTPPVMQLDNNDSDNNESAMASTQMSLNQANTNLGNVNLEEEQAQTGGMYGPKPDPMMVVPGSTPTSGYGTPGTYSSITGGKFDEQGISIDPITGAANPEYATTKAFTNQIMEDPLANIVGDPKNSYISSSDPSAGTGAYQAAIQKSNQEGSANYGMGTLSNQDKIMMKVGMESGIPEHSLMNTRIEDDGTKTHLGTTKQGAQIKGQDLHTYGNIEGVDYGSDVAHGMDANPGDKQGGVYSTMNSYQQPTGSTSGTSLSPVLA
ncbi:hypothetical protein N9M66_06965 [Litoreibacter sp.]|nr:hypothetical protein [Litoreibacter sp.]